MPAAGVLLTPGELFRQDGRASPNWRSNVAHCDGSALSGPRDGLADCAERAAAD